MKHIIRHIAIIALALMATVGAGAETKTVTYTCNDVTTITNYRRTDFSATGDLTGSWTIDLPKEGTTHSASWTLGDVSFKWESSSTYFCVNPYQTTGGEGAIIRASTQYQPWTFTVSSTVYYIQNVKYYNEQNELRLETDNNSKSSSVTTCDNDFGLAAIGGIHKITVTLTTERPTFDLSDATVTGIDANYDYTGSAITPTPTNVTYTPRCEGSSIAQPDGTLTLTAGEDYTVSSYTNNTNAGTATVTLTGKGGYSGTKSVNFTINRVASAVTSVPAPASLTYNGTAQALCTTGSAAGGTLQYSLGGTSWSDTPPTATNAGQYTVYYRVTGDQNHTDIASTQLGTATIAPRERSFGLLTFSETGYAATTTATIADGTDDIVLTEDIAVGSVTYSRTFTVGSAATVMLPFAIQASRVAGGTFYGFIGVDRDGDSGWEVVMQEISTQGGTLQAHTPYLFVPSASQMTFDLGGQTVTIKANPQSTYTVTP